jgi:hypothetical protein
MKTNFGKILRGEHSFLNDNHSGYKHHISKIVDVWNGRNYDDYGILRLFRLTIITSLVFFPGVLIDEVFKSRNYITLKIIVEFYVLLKTIFPIVVLLNGWYVYPTVCLLNIYLLVETYFYLFSKIFLEYQHFRTSNMRTLLLLVFNFVESGLSFAVIYMSGNYLNIQPTSLDAIYYSFVTSATIGYGDIHPITSLGKAIVTTQIFCSVTFLVLFFNFFSGKTSQSVDE